MQTTLEFHWGKHHAAYVANLNSQVKGNQALEGLTLQQVWCQPWRTLSNTMHLAHRASAVAVISMRALCRVATEAFAHVLLRM